VFVHHQPLSILLLKYHRPAKSSAIYFAILVRHLLVHGCGSPNIFSSQMQLGIVIHGELRAFEAGQHLAHAFLILIPAGVLQRGNIKKRVRPDA